MKKARKAARKLANSYIPALSRERIPHVTVSLLVKTQTCRYQNPSYTLRLMLEKNQGILKKIHTPNEISLFSEQTCCCSLCDAPQRTTLHGTALLPGALLSQHRASQQV